MRIDIHVHTKERSRCGKSSATEQVRAAIAAGLDAIVFTDHHLLTPAETIATLNETYAPFKVFGGTEITVNGEDILVLGIQDPLLETEKWNYPDLHAYVRKQGGFMALAHPFRYHAEIQLPLNLFPIDAIEAYSRNTPTAALKRIVALAQELDIVLMSNSDAHATEGLGQHYNVLDSRPTDERELLDMLKKGLFSCVAPDTDGVPKGVGNR